jgi:hypothetical protein
MDITSNASGTVVLLPPGVYLVTVLSDGAVVGQRSLTVSSQRSVDLITTQEPLFPLLVVILSCIIVVIGVVWGIVKKDVLPVLLFLVVGLLVVSLVFPWWSLQGSSSGVETSSVLYTLPLDLLTATKTAEVLAGERAFIPDVFTMVITVMLALMVVSGVCALGSLMVRQLRKKRWQMICLVSAVVLLFGSLVLFYSAMSAFTEVGVGSVLGQGTVEVSVQGSDAVVPVICSWGPGVGFWVSVISLVVLLCTSILLVLKIKK